MCKILCCFWLSTQLAEVCSCYLTPYPLPSLIIKICLFVFLVQQIVMVLHLLVSRSPVIIDHFSCTHCRVANLRITLCVIQNFGRATTFPSSTLSTKCYSWCASHSFAAFITIHCFNCFHLNSSIRQQLFLSFHHFIELRLNDYRTKTLQ